MWYYDGHHFGGMHWIWWILWILFIFWIFATPYDVPGQRKKKESPLNLLQRKFANGEIEEKEYEKRKAILERDKIK